MGLKAVFVGVVLSAQAFSISAVRLKGETFEQARDRNMPREWHQLSTPKAKTVVDSAVEYTELKLTGVPLVADPQAMFEEIRDLRFLFANIQPAWERRISWLYPNDGCFARAALARQLAETGKHGDLDKMFIFGDLLVKSDNALGGEVSWWYHVVPIFKNAKGQVLVMDPAIWSEKPMAFDVWVREMVENPADATYALCSPDAYGPNSPCAQYDRREEADATNDIVDYLDAEWNNLVDLGRDPEMELGEAPPWLTPPPAPVPVISLVRPPHPQHP